MAQPVSTQPASPAVGPQRAVPALAVAGAGLGAALLLGTLILWLHYGTTVFFETIAAGIAGCF
jgi:hypothetical protein